MEKLISMTDFVLEQRMTSEDVNDTSFTEILNHFATYYDKVFAYANFLKQPLTLGMFVPTDEDGNLLKEPKSMAGSIIDGENSKKWAEETIIYEKAKERVLFEGFEMISQSQIEYTWGHILILHFGNGNIQFSFNDYTKESAKFRDIKTIEDLVIAHELKLTETAKKEIELKQSLTEINNK